MRAYSSMETRYAVPLSGSRRHAKRPSRAGGYGGGPDMAGRERSAIGYFDGERDRFHRHARQLLYRICVRDGLAICSTSRRETGFLKVVDPQTMAFADYRGNRQYISAGNFAANDRACLFLMDYVRRTRLKVYAHVERLTLDADPSLTDLVSDPTYRGRAERIFKLRLEAYDWNCPQHIIPRYTEQQVEQAVAPLRQKLQQLEAENAALRARLEGKSE